MLEFFFANSNTYLQKLYKFPKKIFTFAIVT